MSTVQRHETVLEHREKIRQGDALHLQIGKLLNASQEQLDRSAKRVASFRLKSLDDAKSVENADSQDRKREYFWDFNTVEQVLLSCAILVCVAGVMFESDRFQGDISNRYAWQRDLITFLVILVVFFSIVYYTGVFMSEVMGFTPKLIVKLCARKKRAHHSAMRSLISSNEVDRHDTQEIEMHDINFAATNPLQSLRQGNDANQLEENAALSQMVASMMEENRALKKRNSSGERAHQLRAFARPGGLKKKMFGQVQPRGASSLGLLGEIKEPDTTQQG